MILGFAVREDEAITPKQIKPRSNKFTWSRSSKSVPTVVALSSVCKLFYHEVVATGVFYRWNDFVFNRSWSLDLETYLVAITKLRMSSIESLEILWPECYYRYGRNAALRFNAVAACKDLKNLKVNLDVSRLERKFSIKPDQIIGFEDLLKSVPGLRSAKINLFKSSEDHQCPVSLPHLILLGQKMQQQLDKAVQRPKEDRIFSVARFLKLETSVELDVHGEGRLGEDIKPNVVSSRTRGARQRQKKITEDGLLPGFEAPKYDSSGQLAWSTMDITGSQERFTIDGEPRVEFRVVLKKCTSILYAHREGPAIWNAESVVSWESPDVLMSDHNRLFIGCYLAENQARYGFNIVYDMWRSAFGAEDQYVVDLSNRKAQWERQAEVALENTKKAERKKARQEQKEAKLRQAEVALENAKKAERKKARQEKKDAKLMMEESKPKRKLNGKGSQSILTDNNKVAEGRVTKIKSAKM